MPKGLVVQKIYFYIIGLFLFIIGFVFLLAILESPETEINTASKEIVAQNTLQRLIASEDCLSTGEAGVLNRTELALASTPPAGTGRTPELPCAYIPNGAYSLKVDDPATPTEWDWSFGYNYPGGGVEVVQAVTIEDDTGERGPGKLMYNFSFRDNDPALLIAGQVSHTAITGRQEKRTFKNKHKETLTEPTLDEGLRSSRICFKREGHEERCKNLPDGVEAVYAGTLTNNEMRKDTLYDIRTSVNDDGSINFLITGATEPEEGTSTP